MKYFSFIAFIGPLMLSSAKIEFAQALTPKQYCQALQVRTPAAAGNTLDLTTVTGAISFPPASTSSNEILNQDTVISMTGNPPNTVSVEIMTLKFCRAGQFCVWTLRRGDSASPWNVASQFCN